MRIDTDVELTLARAIRFHPITGLILVISPQLAERMFLNG
jgi:hypothetical protein